MLDLAQTVSALLRRQMIKLFVCGIYQVSCSHNLDIHLVFTSPVSFSPDGKHILTQVTGQFPQNNDVLIWRVDELDGLLARGCDWLKDYLTTHPQVRERLKVCWAK